MKPGTGTGWFRSGWAPLPKTKAKRNLKNDLIWRKNVSSDPIPVSLKLEMLSSCQSNQMLLWRTIRHLPTKIVLRQQSLNEFQSSHGKCNFHSQGFLYHWFHLEFEECVENHFSKLEKLVIHSHFYFPIWNIWIYLYVFKVILSILYLFFFKID